MVEVDTMTIQEPKEPVYSSITIEYDVNRATIDDIAKALDDIPGVKL